MLGVVGQHSQRFVIQRADGDDAELRIDRTAGADDVFAQVAGVHVGATSGLAKGIDHFFANLPDPAAIVRVLPVVDAAPADLGRLQALVSRYDALGDLRDEKLGVFRVLAGAQATHRRGRGVRVRGTNHHALRGDAGAFGGQGFGFINEALLHHAGVHDAEGDLHLPIIQHDGTRVELGGHLLSPAFQETSSDDAREGLRRDVSGHGSGAEVCRLERQRY